MFNFKSSSIEPIEIDKIPSKLYGEEGTSFSVDHATSCIAGALIGDSCGSFHEFGTKELSEAEMDFCMTMPGGGPFELNPGQVTDDGELTMCLLSALVEMPARTLDVDHVAGWFKKWILANPFDLEETINNTLVSLKE